MAKFISSQKFQFFSSNYRYLFCLNWDFVIVVVFNLKHIRMLDLSNIEDSGKYFEFYVMISLILY